ncbi:M56 family metallopeptidase [Pseudoflavonifractor capillosus]|uniref:M56 family metallopeptidase n=1 Tax=Pseudoflavonifractor capillosus TaxID=106588 RepID=UPI001958BAE9|nr:M56 family metallopeptidase [Pseudoflavonifractor capillosus]MBM6681790.1 M56 family metallopeptidase [Pseudoflavonifractor capillosus]
MLDNLSALMSVTLGGSVCILLFLAAGPLLSKRFTPRWRYCAWGVLAAVLILFQPFHTMLPKPEDWSGLVQLSIPQAVSENAYDRENARNRDWEEIQKTGNGGRGAETENQDGERLRHSVRYENEAGQTVVIEDNDYVRKVTVGDETTYTVHWTGVAYGAYQAVSVLGVGFVLVRYFWSRRQLLRVSSPAGEEDQAALEAARRRTGCDREAELYRCPRIHTPMLMGFRRPVILLPADVPAGSLEAALAHELTHLKHRDTWYMLLMTLARCVHWFNPLVWLMVRTARRDMELYCDYDLLNGQGEEARRAYGRAILDQMTGRDRGFSGLTTGFSGSKKEVFARFRAMMDTAPKRKGRALLALAAAAIVLSGSLVACQAETQPQTWTAWVDAMDLEERTVTYTLLVDSMGEDMERTAPLAEDAQLLHTYEGEAYPLNPETLRYTQDMAQDGLVGTVELNGRGEVVRVQLNVFSQLDLTAAGLDFTGYCGEVYAAGGVGGINTVSWDEESCWVDPCNDLGQDSDHTVYMLPLAEGCTIQEGLRAYTVGLSSGNYPDLYRLTLVDGAVTAIEGVWPEAENTVTLPNDPEEETPSNPENMPEYDPDFYGENGAEDMPEYDPEFYGESGAQPLEPSGSGTA